MLGRIAALMPRPHRNSTLYSGVLAANAAWRPHVVPPPPPDDSRHTCRTATECRRRLPWAELLYRVLARMAAPSAHFVHGVDALRCDDCGGRYEHIADIRDPEVESVTGDGAPPS